MSLIVAINLPDRLVLLEDGRELPITGMYASSGPTRLKASDALLESSRTDDPEIAEVIAIDIPGSDGAALIVELSQVNVVDADIGKLN